MKGTRVVPAIYCLLFLTILTSCVSNGMTTAGGGVGGTGISQGPITAFTASGSVSVNGVEFSTNGTVIMKNGIPSTQGDLGLGMIVTVQGTFDSDGIHGTANQLDFNDNLEGPIQSIGSDTLVVMGQTVKVDTGTHYDVVTGFGDLQIGYVIEVSGLPQADGTILATYIELKSTSYTPGEEIEIKGIISGLNTSAQTFDIVVNSSSPTSLTVYYNGATLENLPSGLKDGILVEVMSTSGFNNIGQLIAGKVEGLSAKISGSEGTRVELEGFISQFDPLNPNNFDVNGQPVSTTNSTVYENGTSSNLGNNVRVEVEGTLDANGVLIASKISFDD